MLISSVSVSGVTMHGLSHLKSGSTLEALTLATIILILAVAIIVANLIVVATFLNFKGTYIRSIQTDDMKTMIRFRSS